MALPVRISRRSQTPSTYEPFDSVRRDFSDMMSRFFNPIRSFAWDDDNALAPFGVDISEDADHIHVEADMPGFRKEDVDITLENGVLTITAEKRTETPKSDKGDQKRKDKQTGDYLLRERGYRRYQRSFTLPTSVDEDQVEAKLDNGCLCITLNKTAESKPRKIAVT